MSLGGERANCPIIERKVTGSPSNEMGLLIPDQKVYRDFPLIYFIFRVPISSGGTFMGDVSYALKR